MRVLLLILLLAVAAAAQPQSVVPPPATPTPIPRAPNPVTPPEREAVWLFDEARRLHRNGELERAIDLYRKALVQDPGRLEYRPYLGSALDETGQPHEALEQYDLYLKREPADSRVKLMRAAALLHAGEVKAAGQELAALATQRADDPYLHNLHGLLLLRENQAGPAAAEFQSAVNMRPSFLEARINLAAAQVSLGQLEAARTQLDEVLRQAPHDPRAINNLGVLEGNRPQGNETAVQTLERLVSPSPDATVPPEVSSRVPEALFNLASLLARQQQDREALLVVARLLDLRPAMVDAHLLDARLLQRQGRLDEARKEIDQVLAAGPEALGANWAYANEVSGIIYLAQNQDEPARVDLEKAVLAAPDRASAHHNLALALGRLGRFPKAIEEEQRALQLGGEQPAMVYHLGVLYDLDARPAQAVETYRHFLQLAPKDPEAAGLQEHIDDLEARLSGKPGRK